MSGLKYAFYITAIFASQVCLVHISFDTSFERNGLYIYLWFAKIGYIEDLT